MQQRDPETQPVGPEVIRKLYEEIAKLEKRIRSLERKATS